MTGNLDLFFKRRSVRSFLDKPLEPDTIHCLLEAAMAAPTACNSQPWEFVVVTEPATLAEVRENMPFARYNAPCAIVVCANIKIANNSCAKHYWEQDCSAAMENLLLAAVAMDLGGVWIGVHPMPAALKAIHEVLNIPKDVTPLGMAMVGYPAPGAVPQPRTQYSEHRVHWQIYEPKKKHAKIKNAKFAQ